MRTLHVSFVAVSSVVALVSLAGCSSDSSETAAGDGTGGYPQGGFPGSGGSSDSGGSGNGGSGNGGAIGNGGATGNGGSTGNGGGASDGGATGNGGADGGSPSDGGATGNGGATGDGGATGNGGNVGSGGTIGAGGAGTGGSGTGGTGGKPPFVPTGPALTAPEGTWTWIDVAGTKCRDGSASGLAVSLKAASKKVMIYLEGGGACFNSTTCGLNPANSSTQRGAKTGGLFDRTNAKNPVKDWNFVYIPYCTGDVHVGTKDDGTVAGVAGTQHFVGRLNMEKYLNRIVPTFSDATQVLLTGVSAGGFGAAGSADFVAWAFGSGKTFNLIDDSGPPMSSEYVPTCMQDAWRTTWGLDGSMLSDCGTSCPKNNDYLIDYSKFLATKYSANYSGVIDSQGDGVISLFYGFGYNGGAKDCNGSVFTAVPGATFKAGLLDFRSKMASFSKFGTYFPTGTQHTWLGDATLYTGSAGGTQLIDWVTAIVNNTGTSNAGN